MLKESALFELIQPHTDFKVIIGGGGATADFEAGALIITPINTIPITRSDRDFKIINNSEILQSSLIKTTYQLDFYKINPLNADYIHAHAEASYMQEFLKGLDTKEFLKGLEAEILPALSLINYQVEFSEQKKLINRAFFEIQIVSTQKIAQKVDYFDKIQIDNNIIQGA